MSEVKVNKIDKRTGSTLTIGGSGTTVTLACGATQTGFGRTGTVDWCTTAKTAPFTAVSGNGYFVNTTSGTITVTLPATPSAGDIVSIADYTNTFQTNKVTVARNGSNIGGSAACADLTTEGQSVTFVYVDGTEGWKNVQDSTSNVVGSAYITATGGTITCCGDYKIHTFTGPGTFCVSTGAGPLGRVDYLVIAGGGSGHGSFRGGGAGAGGYRESKCATVSGCWTASPLAAATSLSISPGPYSVTVGGGGAAGPNTSNPGNNSVFSSITSAGGGGGGQYCNGAGSNGGSGGGGGGGPSGGAAGTGNTPPVSPPQGNNGGPGFAGNSGGGGGGAGAVGTGPANSAPGGNGVTSSINATPTTRGGGGGAGAYCTPGAGTGGTGGGGAGGFGSSGAPGTAGTANTGGGGGGAGGCPSVSGGAGGSGLVIVRYKYQN